MSRTDQLRASVGHGIGAHLPSRRSLLIGGSAAAGLALTWAAWPRAQDAPINAGPGEQIFGPYLKIGRDGHVAVLVPQTEMGQGVFTLYAQLAADELGADWRTVSVEPAPLSGVYASGDMLERDAALVTPRTGVPEGLAAIGTWRVFSVGRGPAAMMTDEALILSDFEQSVRECAAYARAMLCMAAAARWDADWEACSTQQGFVTLGRRRIRFGELAAEAAQL
ncbi:MAG: molybdopterin cofactor-binding domain-containing protein, partial [Sphingopyxis sp.]